MDNQYKVYCHTNKINGKRYVGITRTSTHHRWDNGNGYKQNRHFWGAIKKYGWDNFEHELLADGLDHDSACEMEKKLIREWNLMNDKYGYNLTSGGDAKYLVSEDTRKRIGDSRRVHGGTGTRLHKCFGTMREKKNNCPSWDTFEGFREWALSNGYSDDLALCRIDDSKWFCPDNCVWLPTTKQHDYRNDKVEIEFNGETHNLKEWADILGIKRATLFTRLYKGWSVERTLSTPVRKKLDGLPHHIERHGKKFRAVVVVDGKRRRSKQCETVEEAIAERDKLIG